MLEQISELVKYYGQNAVVNNPDIPSEDNNAVMAEATKTITSGMQNMLAGGGLQDIISMFTGGGASGGQSNGIAGLLKNPMVMMMVGHLISKLTGKFNMSPSQASQVSNNLVPNVLKDLVTRTNSNAPQDDAFDLNDLIGSLTGGNTKASAGGFNFQDLLGQLTGGSGGNSGGGVDLQDIISQVTRSAQENRAKQTQGGGGIADLIKGFFN
ncbi:MAG: hypothetical protein JNK14_18705 [Chitinophagaceae bacterium]|nr:hypothetical protein [Chitinophagaceae bacterium]